jgi:glucose/arabinose dehydrogenase
MKPASLCRSDSPGLAYSLHFALLLAMAVVRHRGVAMCIFLPRGCYVTILKPKLGTVGEECNMVDLRSLCFFLRPNLLGNWAVLAGVSAAALLAPRVAQAEILGLQRVASGLSSPIFATHAPGDPNRLYIVERGAPDNSSFANASIRILDLTTGTMIGTPFLSIIGVNNNGEGGLLGLAFHPDYETNGKFYVNVTANDAIDGTPFSTFIREYTVTADRNIADPNSIREVLSFGQPQSNHNGGWIGFSPVDDLLYIMSGDGGNGNDTGTGHTSGTGNAQDTTNNLLGKVLRIDVDGDEFPADPNRNYAIPYDAPGRPGNPFAPNNPGETDPAGDNEIWAYGLRNPFRASFDSLTGDLWIGDVGQGAREEIDFLAADDPDGANFGWRLREGDIQTPSGGVGGPAPADHVPPVYDYNRDNDAFGGTVVTGGYRYRGPDPDLQGLYFFGDSRNSFPTTDDNFWTFDPADPDGTVDNIDAELTRDVGSPGFFASFGEDAAGNLYVIYIGTGDVYRIVTDAAALAGDFNSDGDVDAADLDFWKQSFGIASGAGLDDGDADGDGDVDGSDFLVWQQNVTGPGVGAVPEPAGAALCAIAVAAIGAQVRRRNPN